MTKKQRLALREQLAQLPKAAGVPSVDQIRSSFDALMMQIPVRDIATSNITVGGRPALSIEPAGGANEAIILYFHGGGFISGSPRTALALVAELVARSEIRAISVDYRLAPEYPFPAGLDDCLAAYAELLEWGLPASRIVVAGDSAGGNLAIATCLAAIRNGLQAPGAIVAFSPSADMTRSGASMRVKEGLDPFFTRASIQQTGEMYLGGHDPRDPLASPALSGNFTDMPPMLLQVGTDELLLDDSTRLAELAKDAEVDVVLDIVAKVPHVFPSMSYALDEAHDALDRAALFIRQHIGR